MARFDCKGSLLINISHDGDTAYFSISHHVHHEQYVDVVGNRLRGPRFGHSPVDLTTGIEAPIGSAEFEGETAFDKAEKALKSMLDLVRDLKTKSGGGEEQTVAELYRRTLDARSYRVSVSEALAKGGKEKKSKGREKKPGKASAKKRKQDELDELADEGALRQPDPLIHLGRPPDGGLEGSENSGPTEEQMQDLVALYLDRGTSGEGALFALDPALQTAMKELQAHEVEQGVQAGQEEEEEEEDL